MKEAREQVHMMVGKLDQEMFQYKRDMRELRRQEDIQNRKSKRFSISLKSLQVAENFEEEDIQK